MAVYYGNKADFINEQVSRLEMLISSDPASRDIYQNEINKLKGVVDKITYTPKEVKIPEILQPIKEVILEEDDSFLENNEDVQKFILSKLKNKSLQKLVLLADILAFPAAEVKENSSDKSKLLVYLSKYVKEQDLSLI